MIIQPIEIDRDAIVSDAATVGLPYFYLEDEERYYFTKCIGLIDSTAPTLINDLHKCVVAITKYISTDVDAMTKILNKQIADVIYKRPGEISPLQRYDIIYSKEGKMCVVEVNSETPAGTPEAMNQYLFKGGYDHGTNSNEYLWETMCSNQSCHVLFADDEGEDKTNSNYIAGLYREGKIVNAEDLIVEDGKLLAYGEQVENLHTFYPMERIFADEGGKEFWDLYTSGGFNMINGPINLIPQSKAFRAWVFENEQKIIDSGCVDSIEIIHQLVPKYYFEQREGTLSKPRLFREGVGIGEEGIDDCVYQEYIEQMEFEVDTYEGLKTGYITLGMYCNQEESIGIYCRFCEDKITNYTSYFLPIFYTNDEENLSPSDVANSIHPWMM